MQMEGGQMEGGKLQISFGPQPQPADDQTGRILDWFRFGLLQVGNSDHFKVVIALTVLPQLGEPASWPFSSALTPARVLVDFMVSLKQRQ